MSWFDAVLAVAAFATALAVRPWRAVPISGPPWPWLAWGTAMPAMWAADRLSAAPLAPSLSGSCLLMLMAGWPLAVLGMAPVAALCVMSTGMSLADALHRVVWLGIVPATLALALGAALRRWLPRHLFVYILGRGFLCTGVAGTLAGAAAALLGDAPAASGTFDTIVARGLLAWGDAFLAGMISAIFVAFRPEWLATYADRVYLPPRRPQDASGDTTDRS